MNNLLPSALDDLKKKLEYNAVSDTRYYRVEKENGGVFYCKQTPSSLEPILNADRQIDGSRFKDTYHQVSDECDDALHLNDYDVRKNLDLLLQICRHVGDGHYNDWIIDKLASIASMELLHEAESILRNAPARSYTGPIEQWCMSAIESYVRTRHALYLTRAAIISAGENQKRET